MAARVKILLVLEVAEDSQLAVDGAWIETVVVGVVAMVPGV
jgi:hypothetical protein